MQLWEQVLLTHDGLGPFFDGDVRKSVAIPTSFARAEFYVAVGKLLCLCVVHDGAFPCDLARSVFRYLVGEKLVEEEVGLFDPHSAVVIDLLIKEDKVFTELEESLHSIVVTSEEFLREVVAPPLNSRKEIIAYSFFKRYIHLEERADKTLPKSATSGPLLTLNAQYNNTEHKEFSKDLERSIGLCGKTFTDS
ncbi:hypothetical protein RvY_04476 [Ramazzottius varieornatus]|uniref:HECT domain-containing protein n=1 Tax=Ramazzottius varieornatus TaxID=947166 RepID=A0A1D1USE7_RAMVA|nr:hypothetical protein RvY_04476 [Ramazzottius varieornatus]